MQTTPTRILLVDDDPALCRVLRKWLETAGYYVDIADHGARAKEMITAGGDSCPQLLLTDWEMPQIDGLELCRWVRRLDLPHYLYTIFLTSRTSSEDLITAIEAGADDFMKKPVDKGELLARMRAGIRMLEKTNARVNEWVGW